MKLTPAERNVCPKRQSYKLKILQTTMLLRAHKCPPQNPYPSKCQLTNVPKMYKESTSISVILRVLWYARLQSAFRKKLLQWVRHNFIADSTKFRFLSQFFLNFFHIFNSLPLLTSAIVPPSKIIRISDSEILLWEYFLSKSTVSDSHF